MADRFRRPDIPDGPVCPECTDGILRWLPEIEDRFGFWFCSLCGHEQDLVHWLTLGATRRLHTQPDSFGDNPEYVERQDVMSGKAWWQRDINGHSAVRRSRRARIYQVAYTEAQYQLISWSVWMHEGGWTVAEIHQIIKYFWPQLMGQTPLVSRTVFAWMVTRKSMAKKGLEWP